MSLRPEFAAFLSDLEAGGGPTLRELGPAGAREMIAAASPKWWGARDEMMSVADTVVGNVPVRVYHPGRERGATIVFFHGGGWVIGDLDTHDGLCRALAVSSGCSVVSVDYRLAPEAPFPAAYDDCVGVVADLNELAGEHRLDVDRIVLVGESAGGTLAALVAQVEAERRPGRVVLQVLIYPVTDLRLDPATLANGEGYLLTGDDLDWYYRHYAAPELWGDWRVSPAAAAPHQSTPPAYVVTAEFDPLRDQAAAYVEQLRALGVPAAHVDVAGVTHGFALMRALTPATAEMVAGIAAAIAPAISD